MSTSAKRLAAALRAATSDGKPFEVAEFARRWGIEGRPARRAAEGKDVSPTVYLQLCAALGLDPITFENREPCRIPEVDWNRVGIKIIQTCINQNLSVRDLAALCGIPKSPLSRMKAGTAVSTENLLKLCAFVGAHPHIFLKLVPADVSQKHVPGQSEVAT